MTPSWLVVMGDGLDHRLDGPYFLDHQYHRRSTGINFLELLLAGGVILQSCIGEALRRNK